MGVAEAEAKVASAAAVIKGKKRALDDARQTKTFKTEALALVQKLQKTAETSLEAAKQDKDKLSAVFEGSFKTLRDNELEAAEAEKHCAEALAIVSGLPVEASLLTNFPRGAAKAPAARSEFDNLVMEQLEKHIEKHITDCAMKADEAARVAGEHATRVAAAEATLAESDTVLTDITDAVTAAQAIGDEAAAVCDNQENSHGC